MAAFILALAIMWDSLILKTHVRSWLALSRRCARRSIAAYSGIRMIHDHMPSQAAAGSLPYPELLAAERRQAAALLFTLRASAFRVHHCLELVGTPLPVQVGGSRAVPKPRAVCPHSCPEVAASKGFCELLSNRTRRLGSSRTPARFPQPQLGCCPQELTDRAEPKHWTSSAQPQGAR